MRTNIDIDEALLAEAMKALGTKTKKATVETALRHLIDGKKRLQALYDITGTGWQGNLDEMRQGRGFGEP